MKNMKTLVGVNVLLVVVGSISQLYALVVTDDQLLVIASLINLIALLYVILYAIGRYRKSSSYSYKAFLYLFSIAELASIGRFIVNSSSIGPNYESLILAKPYIGVVTEILCVIVPSFCLVAIVLLATNKNLGKKTSMTLGYLITILYAVCFVLSFFINESIFTSIIFGKLILALVTLLMVFAKYRDKDERGAF